jgi:MFS superfamily sulfate permease-like transporter
MFAMHNLKRDLPASVVVFFVALPLCLGIALASGAPLFSGLIAGVVGGAIVGAISRSAMGVSGPAAGLTVIVFAAIETLGSFEAFLVAVVLAGLMQIAFGILRAGVLGYFFPSAVIHGMLTGIGLIIILKQIPHALGYDSGAQGNIAFTEIDGDNTFTSLMEMLSFIHPGAVLISVVSLAILIAWEQGSIARNRWLSQVPGPVVAVAFGVGCQLLLSGSAVMSIDASHLVTVPVATSVGEFVGLFISPDFSYLGDPAVWTVALTIAAVASIETLLSVEAIDKMDPMKRTTPTNRELLAQGVGNTLSGLIGGLPITQVIVRSTVNMQSGAVSRLSAISHGVLLLVCIAAVPHLLNLIPLSVLAAVLLLTGYKLAKPALFINMWRFGHEQFLPFIVTVGGVVFVDLLAGVGMGMAVATLLLLQRNYANSHFLHREERDSDADKHVVTLRLAEEVTFLNKGAIKKELDLVPDESLLIIDQSNCVYVNHDVAEIIADFVRVAPTRGIAVQTIGRKTKAGVRTSDMMAAA